MKHVIAEARFAQAARQGKPESEARILCTCGVVTTSGKWEQHRGDSTRQVLARGYRRAFTERRKAA